MSNSTRGAKVWLQATWVIDCKHLLTHTEGTVNTVEPLDYGDELHGCHISGPYRDAQNRLLWSDNTCPAHTQLIMSRKGKA